MHACEAQILANHMADAGVAGLSSGRMTHEVSPNLNKPTRHVTGLASINNKPRTLLCSWTLEQRHNPDLHS
jgi:hypothetical protein